MKKLNVSSTRPVSSPFALYPTVDGTYYTYEELTEKIKDAQTDKDGKLVILYASDKDAQHSYIEDAKAKGYEVLLLDSPILVTKSSDSKEIELSTKNKELTPPIRFTPNLPSVSA